MRIVFIGIFIVVFLGIGEAAAQTSTNYSASSMWGTAPAGIAVSGATDSSVSHAQNGVTAGQVIAARDGSLSTSGTSETISAIGSQTIVSNTVFGNNNDVDIDATQTATNSGSVENDGKIVGSIF